MNNFLQKTQKALNIVFSNRWHFLLLFLGIFFVTLLVFSWIGFVPESMETANERSVNAAAAENIERQAEQPIVPERISIPVIGVDVSIENPESRDIAILDRALKKGAVRYPGSGLLNENGNMFLFGHSSYLPVIYNRNYQAFNNLQKLKEGDSIYLFGGGLEHRYRVRSVTLADADEIVVDLRKGTGKRLTLSTCNSFGDAEERYVVEADFVGSYSVAS